MKIPGLVVIGLLSAGILASGAIAFETGENRLSNSNFLLQRNFEQRNTEDIIHSDFEGDVVGLPPQKWEVIKGG